MAFNNNVFLRICSRYVFLLLTLCLLYVPSYEVSGQDVSVIYPDTIFSDLTIEYRTGGDFDYYNKAGQRIAGGRKQVDGSYKVFYKGRVRQSGFVAGTEPKQITAGGSSVRQPIVQSNKPSFPGSAFESGANQYNNGTIGHRNMNNNTEYGNIDIKTGKTEIFTGEAMHSRVEARDARVKASEWGQRHKR